LAVAEELDRRIHGCKVAGEPVLVEMAVLAEEVAVTHDTAYKVGSRVDDR
jgi:hypothetical protein